MPISCQKETLGGGWRYATTYLLPCGEVASAPHKSW